jgi:hypothetical protein
VLTTGELGTRNLTAFAARYGLEIARVPDGETIPASFWGGVEAGIRDRCVFARADTPVHSLLHELAHIVCMTNERRSSLDRDAGSNDDEEAAVCYLQVVLADYLPGFDRQRCLSDMDTWGYSFREGSARRWLTGDGQDARAWLKAHGLIDAAGTPSWRLRE